MNYGQAIEAMKKGGFVSRLEDPLALIALVHADTPQRYFERRTGKHSEPFKPSVGDQLAEDWYPSGGVVSSTADSRAVGPLCKYFGANDNVPVEARGQYIGPTRNQPAESRAGSFMQTYTGRQYWPCDPRPHEVFIEDIAHSLSLQCRYAGHCLRFYSVAEHSVLISRSLAATHAPEVALAGLLHDAPEAYCVDIPRPLKPYLTNYKAIEQDNWLAIAERYGLPAELPDEVHDADNRIIADELVNLREMPWHAKHDRPLGVKLRYWSPEEAELEFLATFDALMAGRT